MCPKRLHTQEAPTCDTSEMPGITHFWGSSWGNIQLFVFSEVSVYMWMCANFRFLFPSACFASEHSQGGETKQCKLLLKQNEWRWKQQTSGACVMIKEYRADWKICAVYRTKSVCVLCGSYTCVWCVHDRIWIFWWEDCCIKTKKTKTNLLLGRGSYCLYLRFLMWVFSPWLRICLADTAFARS